MYQSKVEEINGWKKVKVHNFSFLRPLTLKEDSGGTGDKQSKINHNKSRQNSEATIACIQRATETHKRAHTHIRFLAIKFPFLHNKLQTLLPMIFKNYKFGDTDL